MSYIEHFSSLTIRSKCLDFGAGKGELVASLRNYGIDCIGCDIKEWYTSDPSQAFNNLEIGIHLFKSEYSTIPFSDSYFSTIISNQVIEHVHDLESIARELYRVSSDDCAIYLCFPTRELFLEPHTLTLFLHRFKPYGIFSILLYSISHFIKLKKLRSLRSSYIKDVNYLQNSVFLRNFSDINQVFTNAGFVVNDQSLIYLNQRFKSLIPFSILKYFINLKWFFPSFVLLSKYPK